MAEPFSVGVWSVTSKSPALLRPPSGSEVHDPCGPLTKPPEKGGLPNPKEAGLTYESRQLGKGARATGGRLGGVELVGTALAEGLSVRTDDAVTVVDARGELRTLDDPGVPQEVSTRSAATKANAFISVQRWPSNPGYPQLYARAPKLITCTSSSPRAKQTGFGPQNALERTV